MAEAVNAFAEHVRYSDMDDPREPERYLGHWFVDWLKNGNGIEFTGRNYETYLRVCLHVADAVLRSDIRLQSVNSDLEDCYPREIVGIDDPGEPSHYDDRLLFDVSVTRWEHQRRGILAVEEGEAPFRPRPT